MESLAECFSDIPASVLSRLKITLGKSCSPDKETESCPSFQSGTTSVPLAGNPGEDLLTSCAGDFPARTSAPPEKGPDSAESAPVYGLRWPGSLAKYNHHTSLWKTAQCSLFGGLESFSGTWPGWGMMRDGESSALMPLDFHTTEPGCGWLPTPTKCDWKETGSIERMALIWENKRYKSQKRLIHHFSSKTGTEMPSEWEEAIMGWPIGWTDLKPLAMDKFRQWLRLHGKS